MSASVKLLLFFFVIDFIIPCSHYSVKVFHYNGTLYFKKMFDKLYQVKSYKDPSWSSLESASLYTLF